MYSGTYLSESVPGDLDSRGAFGSMESILKSTLYLFIEWYVVNELGH